MSCIKENSVSFSIDKNYDVICMVYIDIVILVLELNVKYFLDVDICKLDNFVLFGYKRNLEVNFFLEKWVVFNESFELGIIIGNFYVDLLSLILISKKCNNIF